MGDGAVCMRSGTGARGRFRGWLRESTGVGGLFAAGLGLAAAEGFFAARWLGLAALLGLAGSLLLVLVRGIFALRCRRLAAAAVGFLALLLLAPAALVGGVAAGFGGRMLRMADHGTRTLPIEGSSLAALVEAGNKVAGQLGGDFKLGAVVVGFGPRGKKVEFEFLSGEPGRFRGRMHFREAGGGMWRADGHTCSGDTETFEANQTRFEQAAGRVDGPRLAWPLTSHVQDEWTEAAGNLAGALSSSAVLGTLNAEWQATEVQLTHSLRRENSDSITIWLKPKAGHEPVASVVTYWAFDGRRARLTEASGIVHRGTASNSTMDQAAEVRSVLEPWLASQDGLLAPSSLYDSRNDSTWTSSETKLPDGTLLVYRQQHAHLFLAEYHMRLEIRPPDGAARDFFLPMNTGGRTAILVDLGKLEDGTPAVRLKAGRHFDLGFTLDDPRMIPPAEVREAVPLGAFTGVKTPLRWVSASDPADRELYRATRQYAVP